MKQRSWLVLLLALVAAPTLAFWQPWHTRLKVIRAGGKGPPTIVLIHGYGSAPEYWLPYTKTIAFPAEGRFLSPYGPEQMHRKDSTAAGRAWWDLDLAAHLRHGMPGVDLRQEDPAGLRRAGRLVRRMMEAEGNGAAHPFILGGFSQGAMVSCEVAFSSDAPLAALFLLSGTPNDRANWRAQMVRRKEMPVFMAHGRADDILPFDLAEKLRDEMLQAGLRVTFVPFDGGHEIPGEVIVALGQFLAQVGR